MSTPPERTIRARETDEAVAELLVTKGRTLHEIVALVGCRHDAVYASFDRLRRIGLPVEIVGYDDPLGRKRGRGQLSGIYRIVHAAGRVCAAEGCVTLLRTTNPSDRCELHGGGTFSLPPLPEPPQTAPKRCPGVDRAPHVTTDFGKNRSYCRMCWRLKRRDYQRAKAKVYDAQ